eukprot:2606754-Pleurochrysis_carterae.AAC.6
MAFILKRCPPTCNVGVYISRRNLMRPSAARTRLIRLASNETGQARAIAAKETSIQKTRIDYGVGLSRRVSEAPRLRKKSSQISRHADSEPPENSTRHAWLLPLLFGIVCGAHHSASECVRLGERLAYSHGPEPPTSSPVGVFWD